MPEADELDAASGLVDSGPAATQGHAAPNYGSGSLKKVEVPRKPRADMSGVPPEQWARPVKRKR